MSIFTGTFSDEDFFKSFKQVTPNQKTEKSETSEPNIISIDNLASTSQEGFENLKELLGDAGINEVVLKRLDRNRIVKRNELELYTEEEKDDLDPEKHDKILEEKAKEIIKKGICGNFDFLASDESVFYNLSQTDENNVILVDVASYSTFSGYNSIYKSVNSLSNSLYKRFGIYGKNHKLSKISPGNATFNLDSRGFVPKIKGIIHTVGPDARYQNSFDEFYQVLDNCIKSIFTIVKGLINDGIIDEETVIRLPLISSGKSGSYYVQDRVYTYYPKLINSIKNYFSEETSDMKTECRLINPVELIIYDEKDYESFARYENNLGIQECWAYDFDGVVHRIVTDDNDSLLTNQNFDTNWQYLEDSLFDETIEDMKRAENFSRIIIISELDEKFKNSIYMLLTSQDVSIEETDIYMGNQVKKAGGKERFLNELMVTRGLKIYKFVEDEWNNIVNIFRSVVDGYLPTLKKLYWVDPLGQKWYNIDIFKKNLEPPISAETEILLNKLADIIPEENKSFWEEWIKKAYDLYHIYKPLKGVPTNFPEDSIEVVIRNYERLTENVTVYYDDADGARFEDIKKLVLEREPCNISSVRYYDQQLLRQKFGWNKGYYDRYYEEIKPGNLAPNIAIFTRAKLLKTKAVVDENLEDEEINIINSVGYAFDSKNQVDYKHFLGGKDLDNASVYESVKNELIEAYKNVFNKIFSCAVAKELSILVFSFVGSANFAKLFPGHEAGKTANPKFLKDVFAPAFEYILNKYLALGQKFTIYFMGAGKESKTVFSDAGFTTNFKDIGYFPSCINATVIDKNVSTGSLFKINIKENLNNILFVNAWDHLSIQGNGNIADKSLDGFIGRNTTVGLTGTAMTNPELRNGKRFVQILNPENPGLKVFLGSPVPSSIKLGVVTSGEKEGVYFLNKDSAPPSTTPPKTPPSTTPPKTPPPTAPPPSIPPPAAPPSIPPPAAPPSIPPSIPPPTAPPSIPPPTAPPSVPPPSVPVKPVLCYSLSEGNQINGIKLIDAQVETQCGFHAINNMFQEKLVPVCDKKNNAEFSEVITSIKTKKPNIKVYSCGYIDDPQNGYFKIKDDSSAINLIERNYQNIFGLIEYANSHYVSWRSTGAGDTWYRIDSLALKSSPGSSKGHICIYSRDQMLQYFSSLGGVTKSGITLKGACRVFVFSEQNLNNVTNFLLSPLKMMKSKNYKYLSPTSKVKNSRIKKMRKIKKMKEI
jgi:hypothetical protein